MDNYNLEKLQERKRLIDNEISKLNDELEKIKNAEMTIQQAIDSDKSVTPDITFGVARFLLGYLTK